MGTEHRLDDGRDGDDAFDWLTPARALEIPEDEARAIYRAAVRRTAAIGDPHRAERIYLGWLTNRSAEAPPGVPGRATLVAQDSSAHARGYSIRRPSAPGRRTLSQELDLPQPLPSGTRTRMEEAFRQSFADVHLHVDSPEVSAGQQAITRGRDIFLERGAFELGSARSDEVLAHELAHVAQHAAPVHPRGGSPGVAMLEADARRAARDALAGRPAAVRLHAPAAMPLGFSEVPRSPHAQGARGGAGERTGVPGPAPAADARAGTGHVEHGAPPLASAGAAPAVRPSDGGTSGERAAPQAPARERGGAVASAGAPGARPSARPGRGGAAGASADGVLLPEPPAALSPAAQARLDEVGAQNRVAAEAARDLPSAEQSTAQARDAVAEPQTEQDARAQAAVVADVDDRPPPSPEIEAACERIREVISAKRPPDEARLVEAQPREMAREAGQQMSAGVEARAGSVRAGYADMQAQPQGQPSRQPVPVDLPPEQVPMPPVDAAAGAPEELAEGDVSLERDVAAQRQRVEDAGMTTEPAQLVQDGPIAEARGGVAELQAMAQTDPQRVLAEQAAAVTQARGDMQALQAAATQLLQQARTGAVQDLGRQSGEITGTEEQKREQAGARMQAVFQRTQQAVDRLLQPLGETALARWNTGIDTLSTEFETSLATVKQRIEERYRTEDDWDPFDEIGSSVTRWSDDTFGLPGWVVAAYDIAEAAFADGATNLIRDISRDVNAVIRDCQTLIQQARRDIDAIVQGLPDELQAWAQGEAARLGDQLDALDARVTEAQSNLNRDLVDRANTAVQDVRERVHDLRVAAGGLLGRIAAAIEEFLRDPARAIVNGLLQLVGIPPASFWGLVERLPDVIAGIAEDPMGFANTLLAGVGQGFQQFFDNFPGHIGRALFQWLFSKLGEAGVAVPSDFSPRSILGVVLDVLGISWERIRRLLARHIGEQNAQLLDQAYQVIATLIERGPQGLIDMFVEQLDPQTIVDMLLQAALDFVMETVITQVATRILLMLNPAGAILQAIEAIYRVLSWVIENAARVFTLIESLVNGAAAILAGDTSGVANLVEGALVGLMVPVIDFLADYLGLGNLPAAIRDVVLGLQSRVEAILDRIIGFIADQARTLMQSLRGGGQQQTDADGMQIQDGQVGEPQEFTSGDESHRLWAEERGASYVLMVASTPEELGSLLDSRRVRQLSERDPEFQEDVRRAKRILQLADTAIQRIVDASRSNDSEQLHDEDEDLEQQMRALVSPLQGVMHKVSASRSPTTIEKLFQEQNQDIRPDTPEWNYGDRLEKLLEHFGLAIQSHRSGGPVSGKDTISQIRGDDKKWTVHQGAIWAPFVTQQAAAVEALSKEAEDCNIVLSFERGGLLLQDQITSGTGITSQGIRQRRMSTTEISDAVERGHISAEEAQKLREQPNTKRLQQKADLRAEIDRIMAPDPEQPLTLAIAETRVGGGSLNFIIKIVNDVIRTGQYPNLRFRVLALDQTMHRDDGDAAGITYAPVADADRVKVAIHSTEYILGEDVDFQTNFTSKRPIIIFKFTGEQMTAYRIAPQEETISRDIIIDLVDGAYNSFLPGVL